MHPLQAYFLLAAATLGFALRWLEPRKRFDGQIVLIYLMLHESAKWLLEFLRADPVPSVQLASGLLGAVAWLIFLLARRKFFIGRTRPRLPSSFRR